MALLAFDIGGTAVKYGLFRDGVLEQTNSFATPATWEEMKKPCLRFAINFQMNH